MKQMLEKICNRNFRYKGFLKSDYKDDEPKYIKRIHGKEVYSFKEGIIFIKDTLKQEILTLVNIENVSYSMFGEHCIKIIEEDGSFLLVALNEKGINQLGFLRQNFPRESTIPIIKEDIDILKPEHLTFCKVSEGKEEIIFALKTSKLEDVKDYSLETLRRIYEDIKPTISRYFIDGLDIGKIKYLKEFDTYVITEIDDYIEYNGAVDKIELSFESFLNGNSFYQYKNKAINLKEYNFLKGVE